MSDAVALYRAPAHDPSGVPVGDPELVWRGVGEVQIEWADSDLPAEGGGWEPFGAGFAEVTDARLADLLVARDTKNVLPVWWLAWGETFFRVDSSVAVGNWCRIRVCQGARVLALTRDFELVCDAGQLIQLCIPEPSPPQWTSKWWHDRTHRATEHLLARRPDLDRRAAPPRGH